jgi:hypothetical protein
MPILGLQDSYDLSTYREGNWRRAILLRFPNGMVQLTGFMNLLKSEESDDPKFNWMEKAMPTQSAASTTALNNTTDDSFILGAADAYAFRPGHIIRNETQANHEVMKVTNVSADGLTVTVLRGNWGTKYATDGATDVFAVIGNANAEGSGSPESLGYAPDSFYNFTQIFKTPFDLTGTGLKTSVRYDPSGAWPEKMREALMTHGIEHEKAAIFGKRAEYTGANGKKERTSGGILEFISAANKITGVTTLTYDLMNGYLEQVFRTTLNSNQEKLMLAGSGFLNILNKVCKNNATMNILPKQDVFGMTVVEWVTPYGTLYIKIHPLFSHQARWRNNALIVDPAGCHVRPLRGRDTKRQQNIQDNDADLRKDQFMDELGFEWQHGDAHMWLEGFTTAGT